MISSNHGYGREPRGITQTDMTDMECFDLCGPKLRRVINNAQIRWSAKNLFIEGCVRRNMSDEEISEHVRNNDRRTVARLEAERDAGKGVWSLKGFKLKTSRHVKAERYGSPEFRKAALERALERSNLN